MHLHIGKDATRVRSSAETMPLRRRTQAHQRSLQKDSKHSMSFSIAHSGHWFDGRPTSKCPSLQQAWAATLNALPRRQPYGRWPSNLRGCNHSTLATIRSRPATLPFDWVEAFPPFAEVSSLKQVCATQRGV